MKIPRGVGATESERRLVSLCDDTFLKLWSYPNVFRSWKTGQGKEVCDLLVVCGDALVIFSDKACKLPLGGDVQTEWGRWYRKALCKAAAQLRGAERRLRAMPADVFLDPQCTVRIPSPIMFTGATKVHRVIVARGAFARHRQDCAASSGLILDPTIVGDAHVTSPPFRVGRPDAEPGLIHVWDGLAAEIILSEMDTVTDLLDYLDRKEAFILAGKLGEAASEGDLLGTYLNTLDGTRHAFPLSTDGRLLAVGHGVYESTVAGSRYREKRQANQVSYVCDEVIRVFEQHALAGTLMQGTSAPVSGTTRALRAFALMDRLERRLFGEAIVGVMKKAEAEPRELVSRIIQRGDGSPGPMFVIQLTAQLPGQSRDEYRKHRENLLADYCFGCAYQFRDRYTQVIGLATDKKAGPGQRSFDLVHWEIKEWGPDECGTARRILRNPNILNFGSMSRFAASGSEYPGEGPTVSVTPLPRPTRTFKRRKRPHR